MVQAPEQQETETVAAATPESDEISTEDEPVVSQEAPADAEAEPTAPPEAPASEEPAPDVQQQEETPAVVEPEAVEAPPVLDPNVEELKVLRPRVEDQRREIRELQEARQREQSQRAIDERVEAYRREEREWLERQNVDPVEAAQRLDRSATERRQQLENEVHQREVVMHFVQERQTGARTALESGVTFLAQRYGLDEANQQTIKRFIPTDLLTQETLINPNAVVTEDPRFREVALGVYELAQQLGTATKATQEATAARRATVQPQQLETATGAGVMSDAQKVAAYGDIDSDYNDHEEARKAMVRLGYIRE